MKVVSDSICELAVNQFNLGTGEVYIINADAYNGILSLQDECIDVVITSPPYYKQRDYGFEKQIGQENTPEEYIENLTKIFSLLLKKLSPRGVLFLNIGDKYLAKYGKSTLAQIPYRLGLSLQKQGWRLLDILIWYKPNHMPLPVKDRFVNSYEPVIVFAKSEDNLYIPREKVLFIPLEPTPYKHTAVFPRKLVLELLKRTDIEKVRTILDPFAGTGTVGEVSRKLSKTCFLIEPLEEYVETIKERLKSSYSLDLKELDLDVKFSENSKILSIEHKSTTGMIQLFNTAEEFNHFMELMRTTEFKRSFDESALFFIGCKEVSLEVLTKPYYITSSGYVLRNMIVIRNGTSWFPIFMMAFDTKKQTYQFNLKLDDQEKMHTLKITIDVHTKVHDNLNKKKGYVRSIIDYYDDGLPSLVEVEWEDKTTEVQSIVHPKDEVIRESILFICPFCNAELDKRIVSECSSCGRALWTNLSSVPRIATRMHLQKPNFIVKCVRGRVMKGRSKYKEIPNYNWGASPAARKKVVGDMLTKVRLYEVPQPFFARFLKVLMKERELNIKKLVDIFGENYKHTIPHWLREDLGGSLPKLKDLVILEEVFGSNEWFSLLKLTALKVQTVKPSINGKMPEDFLEDVSIFLKLFNHRLNDKGLP